MTEFKELDSEYLLEKLIKSNKPIILKFFAPWCNPSKQTQKDIQEALSNIDFDIDLLKVNIDHFPELAKKYNVKGIPAVFASKGPDMIESVIGAKDKDFYTIMFNDLKRQLK